MKEKLYDETQCSCGNGYCNAGETELNCPMDCARIFRKENLCKFGKIPLFLLIMLTLLMCIRYYKQRKKGIKHNMVYLSVIAVLIVADSYYYLKYFLACTQSTVSVIILFLLLVSSVVLILLQFFRWNVHSQVTVRVHKKKRGGKNFNHSNQQGIFNIGILHQMRKRDRESKRGKHRGIKRHKNPLRKKKS